MREKCSCGAEITAKPKRVVKWRSQHRHPDPKPPAEPEKGGSTATTQIANSPMGFRRNDEPTFW